MHTGGSILILLIRDNELTLNAQVEKVYYEYCWYRTMYSMVYGLNEVNNSRNIHVTHTYPLPYNTMLCYTNIMPYYTVLYYITLHYIMVHYTILYYTILYILLYYSQFASLTA